MLQVWSKLDWNQKIFIRMQKFGRTPSLKITLTLEGYNSDSTEIFYVYLMIG